MITFQKIFSDDAEAFTWIARWDNDPNTSALSRPNFTDEPLPKVTVHTLQQQAEKSQDKKKLYLIKENGCPIGYVSIEADFFMLLSHPQAAWISICIGEIAARGKGIGKIALDFIESEAVMQGFRSIELGVFAYNLPVQALYRRCGYQQFAEVPEFVWYQGRRHADLRFYKQLTR